jgi:hypothetical protein
MRSGSVYARPTSAPPTADTGSSSSPGLLPTPSAADGAGGPGHSGRDGGLNLRTAAPQLLPTPKATDGTKGGPNQHGSSGDLALPSAVMLLPTPVVTDAKGTRNATSGRRDGSQHHTGTTLTDAVSLMPTPRAGTARSSRRAMTDIQQWTAPSLEQAIELSQGVLPREFDSWDEVPGWHGGLTPPPSAGGSEP